MKKSNKINKTKKILIILIPVLIIIAIIILITSNKNKKNYDLTEIEKTFTSYYQDINLESLSEEDITLYFTLPIKTDDHALLLSNFNPNIELTEEEEEPNLLLIITDLDKDMLNEYYDAIEGFVGSYIKIYDGTEDNKLVNLYNDAILTKGKDYFYLIMGTKNNELEEELNKLYK